MQKEGSCNITHNTNLLQKTWVFKGYQLGCHPSYNEQKRIRIEGNQTSLQTDLLDNILSSIYKSRSKYASQGENYILEEYKMPETCCANFDKLEKTTASLVQKR